MNFLNGSKADIEVFAELKNIPVDFAAFSDLCVSALRDPHTRDGIGTYKEKKLHLILKEYFVRSPDEREVPFRGFVCDGKNSDGITEVMTGSLSGMKDKLSAFLPDNRVNVIFPIISEKTLFWIDPETGGTAAGRISPRHDGIERLLSELIYVLDYLDSPNFYLTAVYLKADEFRIRNGRGKEKKIGAEKYEIIPSEIISIIGFRPLDDMRFFLPEGLPDFFSRKDFSRVTGLTGRRIWGALKTLEETGVIVDAKPGSRPRCFKKSQN